MSANWRISPSGNGELKIIEIEKKKAFSVPVVTKPAISQYKSIQNEAT